MSNKDLQKQFLINLACDCALNKRKAGEAQKTHVQKLGKEMQTFTNLGFNKLYHRVDWQNRIQAPNPKGNVLRYVGIRSLMMKIMMMTSRAHFEKVQRNWCRNKLNYANHHKA